MKYLINDKCGRRWLLGFFLLPLIVGCVQRSALGPGSVHIQPQKIAPKIPQLVTQTPLLPAPVVAEEQQTFTVVVHDVPVSDLIFSLARDGDLNVDLHPGIEGRISMNAIDQTFTQILERIAFQIPLRYQMRGSTLEIIPDQPFWQTYTADYLNISRKSSSTVQLSSQVATVGSSGSGGSNASTTNIDNTSDNTFWERLQEGIEAIVKVQTNPQAASPDDAIASSTDGAAAATPAQAGANAPSSFVIVHRETGLIKVFATERQHKQVQNFIVNVVGIARRQVMIEATIVEVNLSDDHQSGVDWRSNKINNGIATVQSSNLGGNIATAPFLSMVWDKNTKMLGTDVQFNMTLRFLRSFGDVRVLSSPRIMTLNSQTAVLKVVDDTVYFQITVTPAITDEDGRITPATFASQVKTVPVGLVMVVTPQISAGGTVSLNIRPTISRITRMVTDPGPRLNTPSGTGFFGSNSTADNLVPEIQVREMESVLRVNSGQTVVLGGLMSDRIEDANEGMPALSQIPGIGALFEYRKKKITKTELVIFLRPTVITGDENEQVLDDFKGLLPKSVWDMDPTPWRLKHYGPDDLFDKSDTGN